ncbi:non-ribosomal peptide synthetase [Vibrio quintilis]|uniref:Dimodular nonribosomal peptide synthase n=1 Tax=Vibrio quintilis TaxID=1117707 RepID=A0A1M7YYR8_9VIBR|nr:non-ribosomal peptide synthetase [Vibrio quintilis]SHO57837.1 Dimodular nonribosomal peptide synthase [Vibrio quintilis]
MFEASPPQISTAQKEVYLAIQHSGVNRNYHLCDILEIKGKPDINLLRLAVQMVFTETEAIRVCFQPSQQTALPEQIVQSEPSGVEALEYIDLSDRADPKRACQTYIQAQIEQEMNPETGPLARFILICTAPDLYDFVELGSHLIIDEYTRRLISGRIVTIYNALYNGLPVKLAEYPPLETAAQADADYPGSPEMLKDRRYWLDYCAHLPEPVQLVPGDAPLTRLLRLRRVISGHLVTRLRTIATRHSLSMPELLMAACATYIYRTTGEPELVFGMPVAARQLKALHHIPAMVANILPLHLFLNHESTVLSVAVAVQRQLHSHLRHQTYRHAQLVQDLQEQRGNTPLFKILLNVAGYDQTTGFSETETRLRNQASGPADHLGIDIFDRNTDGSLEFGFNANGALFTQEDLNLHFQRFLTLLTRLADQPSMPVPSFSLFLDHEAERVYPCPATIARLPVFRESFQQSVNRYAGQTAIICGEQHISYQMLDDYADRLTGYLLSKNIAQNQCVAVLASRSLESIIAMTALFRLGICYVPVDPELPPERIEYILQDTDPALFLITDQTYYSCLLADKQCYLSVALLAHFTPPTQTLPAVDPFSLAYLIYTSGTTGQPKGIEVTHRNLVAIARSMIAAADILPGQRLLQFIAPGFDMSVLEFMMATLSGATLVIADKLSATPGKPLAQLLRQQQVGLLVMTPSLLACHQAEDFTPGTTILLGGEPCTATLLARFSHCRLLNVYGPAETSFSTSVNADFHAGDLSIGVPTANTRLYVVDPHQQLLPPGSWGELMIGGAGVARGYRNQPALTEEYFVPDLLNENETMYKVGDRVYFATDGKIYYQGRQDHQITIRGLRIEPDKIKNVMLSFAGVEDAVVLVKELRHGPVLTGYVAGQTIDTEDLRSWLSYHLPSYMVPAMIIPVQAFPLTINGKLAVRELPEPEPQKHSGQSKPAVMLTTPVS